MVATINKAEHAKTGNSHPNHAPIPAEYKPETIKGIPPVPNHLTQDAIPIWHHLCKVLDDMGIITKSDMYCIGQLAEACADMRRTRRSLMAYDDGNPVYVKKTSNGDYGFTARPEIKMIQAINKEIAVWVSKLGLSPADRTKVSKILEPTTNPFNELED